MATRLVQAPAVEPITLAAAKAHLRAKDFTDDDETIAACIAAARAWLDPPNGWLGRALITQTWELVLDAFPGRHHRHGFGAGGSSVHCGPRGEIRIPYPPLQEVVSITYYDSAGDLQTLDPSTYTVDDVNQPGWVVPNSGTPWPATLDAINTVIIKFICGYGDADTDIPPDIAHAMKLIFGHMYENREQVISDPTGRATAVEVPLGYQALLAPVRVW